MKREVAREKNIFKNETYHKFLCIVCDKELVVRWNGGELDCTSCCGLHYEAEHQQVDLVVTKEIKS